MRLQDWVERVVRGAVPPERGLASLDEEVDRMLEKRRWLREHGRIPGGTP
jgi:hypothetical protein